MTNKIEKKTAKWSNSDAISAVSTNNGRDNLLLTLQTQNKAPNECRDSRLKSSPRSKLERKFARSQHQCRQPATSPRASESIPRWICVFFSPMASSTSSYSPLRRDSRGGTGKKRRRCRLPRMRCTEGRRTNRTLAHGPHAERRCLPTPRRRGWGRMRSVFLVGE